MGFISIPEENNPELVRLSFTVKDTGIGIPTDKIDRLFHSFNHPKGLCSSFLYIARRGLLYHFQPNIERELQ
ncbi:hypothetical protein FC682_21290 [Peribacillus simplex]|uniref:Histidine kinase/HSP90-like ATPase domain-containing protein n=1 Tax=Peribacillus simplex TaxID=1478 RepID=A0A9X9EUF1_9BACI|nr:hypothetical protein FC682_21290 [Peribacillus simplex]TKH15925.1 hypothetical protein FC678_01305 [Peribacillus simplex]